MLLLRVGQPASKVADDVRASLTALGRGSSNVGGIALLDVRPDAKDDTVSESFAAVVVTPRGIVIAAGIDLPGPAMRLEAPLQEQWKADNWPLVGSGDSVNPASGALAAAEALAARLNTLTNSAMPVSLVLAVGPFVDQVVTVPARGQAVRVIHPTPPRMRETVQELLENGGRPCSAEQARAVLRTIAPDAPIQSDEVLAREGFTTSAAGQPATHNAETAKAAALAAAGANFSTGSAGPKVPSADDQPTDLMPVVLNTQPEGKSSGGPRVRLLPAAAVLLVLAGLIAAIVLAANGSAPDDEPPPGNAAPKDQPHRYAIAGVQFTEVAATESEECGKLTFGDVQAFVQQTPCSGMQLSSYLADVSGKQAAVSLAVIDFAEPEQAGKLKELADKAGSGGAADAANLDEKWPDLGALPFHNAVYRSRVDTASVLLVRTAWVNEAPGTEDELLARIAKTSFDVPVE